MPAVTSAASVPGPVRTSTGFTVSCAGGGGLSDYGQVWWAPYGHALMTPAGIQALASQAASYHGALSSLTNGEQINLRGPCGSYVVKNADLATQQAAIVAILSSAANVTGVPS